MSNNKFRVVITKENKEKYFHNAGNLEQITFTHQSLAVHARAIDNCLGKNCEACIANQLCLVGGLLHYLSDGGEADAFTGFQDKHRNDIYENDILTVKHDSYFDVKEVLEVVTFIDGSFYSGAPGSCAITLDFTNVEKVVGNAHQNPELLPDIPQIADKH